MKRLRFLTGVGNGVATIPDGQVLSISMVPNATAPNEGSYVKINESRAIFVPTGSTLSIEAAELGYVDDQSPIADRWPGDGGGMTIEFGAAAPVDVPGGAPIGGPPASWLVIVNGCY